MTATQSVQVIPEAMGASDALASDSSLNSWPFKAHFQGKSIIDTYIHSKKAKRCLGMANTKIKMGGFLEGD